LPWTKVEINEVGDLLKQAGFSTTLYNGLTATEESVKVINSPRVLHLATHGYFFPDPKAIKKDQVQAGAAFKLSEYPMIRAGMILAVANHAWQTGVPLRPNMEDGILTAYEASQLYLENTELVVLSACETGLGEIQSNEGVYGLQRAFKIAGARYLIMSLWQVPDFQAQVFMTAFYTHWLSDKQSIPDAFRAAQSDMRTKYGDPFLWAGFVLVE
jgi:CHAT domain-containing protein